MQHKTKIAHFSVKKKKKKRFLCLKTNVCIAICFSARNRIMVTAGINVMIKENGQDALHLPSYYSDLHPNELVRVDIKNREADKCMYMNFKEMPMFYEKRICLIHKRKMPKLLLPHEVRRGILTTGWLKE
jgi:hypothetical protein